MDMGLVMMRWFVSILLFWLLLQPTTPAYAQWRFADLWLTPDQQGQRLFGRQRYQEAAERYTDPMRKGVALFRAAEFEQAAALFGRIESAPAAYNRGNALVMLGRYQEAISSYQRALQLRPGWPQAEQNMQLAEARQAKLAPPEDDAGGTGGMLAADEIVIDDSGRVDNSDNTQTDEGAGGEMSDAELRTLWLRRVQTRPADFLRAKFAYQRARQQQAAP
jgi:Ca-activated chloride channel family protein